MKPSAFLKAAGLFLVSILVACAPKAVPVSTETSMPVETNVSSENERLDPSEEKGVVAEFLKCVRPVYEKYRQNGASIVGDMKIQVFFRKSGDVDSVQIVESTVKYPEFEKSIQESLMLLKHDHGGFGSPAFTTSITFSDEGVFGFKNERSPQEVMAAISGFMKTRLPPIYAEYVKKHTFFNSKMVVNISIAGSGAVDSVEIVESNIGNPEFEKAVADDIKQWKFESGKYDVFNLGWPLRFRNGGPKGPRDGKKVFEIVEKNKKERLYPIYYSFLKKHSRFSGKITLHATVNPDGSVQKVDIIHASTNYPEFEKAIADDIMQWNFGRGTFSNSVVEIQPVFSDDRLNDNSLYQPSSGL
ncbi:AgmX/PglI C-terminal domain-containing protein [Fibrobacter sp. UWB11]|uniref:AgmX/PglI C-terminal domain-containing protein n=1 Tax=Fibrobacter sp. UWB11 TaxID=1896202 RepID=UPI00092A48F5|nr:AgmX/PglI C-terminal domain-containing protein [Fibrobacter sp. UWB11]SIO27037.1 TonB family C-terminal domain-containing protein [Fibrobacter sp. UWB11]